MGKAPLGPRLVYLETSREVLPEGPSLELAFFSAGKGARREVRHRLPAIYTGRNRCIRASSPETKLLSLPVT